MACTASKRTLGSVSVSACSTNDGSGVDSPLRRIRKAAIRRLCSRAFCEIAGALVSSQLDVA
jgi:hypothetical protein